MAKGWHSLKKELDGLLCPELKKRVRYFMTSYLLEIRKVLIITNTEEQLSLSTATKFFDAM